MPTQRMYMFLVTAGVLFSLSTSRAQVAPLLPGVTQQLATASLPDSPGAVIAGSSAADAGSSSAPLGSLGEREDDGQQSAPAAPSTEVASKYATTIKAGQTAQPLSAEDKFALAFRKQAAPSTLALWILSAGYSHVLDNRPHYGVDRAGFGERLGSIALRDTTQTVLNYGVFSSIFHTDPRYYVLGPHHPLKQRLRYSISRVLIVRRDAGGNAPNWALLAGAASSAALANAYYPARDQKVGLTISGFFSSLAVRTGTYTLREFSGELRHALHLKSN